MFKVKVPIIFFGTVGFSPRRDGRYVLRLRSPSLLNPHSLKDCRQAVCVRRAGKKWPTTNLLIITTIAVKALPGFTFPCTLSETGIWV